MVWADRWQSDDGLQFSRQADGWRVEIVRDLPKRLGDPCSVELPAEGAVLARGAVLMAIELSKARVEFAAPELMIVCESRNLSAGTGRTRGGEVAWSLVIQPLST